MKRILTVCLVLALASAATYLWMERETPAEGPESAAAARGTDTHTPGPADARTALAEPEAPPQPKAVLERPPETNRAAPVVRSRGPVGGAGSTAAVPVVDVTMPAALPVDDEAPEELIAKYANATPVERRQALESLGLIYKDATNGTLKTSEQDLRRLEQEMRWLDAHIDG